jgi:hypothetical protein
VESSSQLGRGEGDQLQAPRVGALTLQHWAALSCLEMPRFLDLTRLHVTAVHASDFSGMNSRWQACRAPGLLRGRGNIAGLAARHGRRLLASRDLSAVIATAPTASAATPTTLSRCPAGGWQLAVGG